MRPRASWDDAKLDAKAEPQMRIIDLHAAKTQFPRPADAAAAGEEIISAKSGKPIVRVGPLTDQKSKRKLDVLAGKLRVPEDFDAPLPDGVLNAFESHG